MPCLRDSKDQRRRALICQIRLRIVGIWICFAIWLLAACSRSKGWQRNTNAVKWHRRTAKRPSAVVINAHTEHAQTIHIYLIEIFSGNKRNHTSQIGKIQTVWQCLFCGILYATRKRFTICKKLKKFEKWVKIQTERGGALVWQRQYAQNKHKENYRICALRLCLRGDVEYYDDDDDFTIVSLFVLFEPTETHKYVNVSLLNVRTRTAK